MSGIVEVVVDETFSKLYTKKGMEMYTQWKSGK
jgi:hypothetical protein